MRLPQACTDPIPPPGAVPKRGLGEISESVNIVPSSCRIEIIAQERQDHHLSVHHPEPIIQVIEHHLEGVALDPIVQDFDIDSLVLKLSLEICSKSILRRDSLSEGHRIAYNNN